MNRLYGEVHGDGGRLDGRRVVAGDGGVVRVGAIVTGCVHEACVLDNTELGSPVEDVHPDVDRSGLNAGTEFSREITFDEISRRVAGGAVPTAARGGLELESLRQLIGHGDRADRRGITDIGHVEPVAAFDTDVEGTNRDLLDSNVEPPDPDLGRIRIVAGERVARVGDSGLDRHTGEGRLGDREGQLDRGCRRSIGDTGRT